MTTWDYRPGTNALWKKTDHANHAVVYTYRADGLLETRTNARQIEAVYDYETGAEGLAFPGRVSGITYSDTTPALDFPTGMMGTWPPSPMRRV